jgi:two-component system LytT family response regulator
MTRAIIIDDEQHCIDRLERLLRDEFAHAVQLLQSFDSVETGLRGIQLLQPELVFLDVQIHDKTGFDLLKALPEKNFEVIFTTAFEKYAVQAFRFSAIDYLLKPIETTELSMAIQKLQLKTSASDLGRKFETLLGNMDQFRQFTPPKKLIVPTINGFELLPVMDIIRCQSDINYTTIYMKDKGKLVVARTLKEFEEMLGEYRFFRLHNSHLVNLAFIKSYNKGKGGSVTLLDGTAIEVSTRRKEELLKKLSEI